MANQTFLQSLALFSRRRYRMIFPVTLILVLAAIGAASRLRLDTDVLSLLPKNDPGINRYRAALEEFGSLDYLLVVVRIPEGAIVDPYLGFADRLGERMSNLEELEQVDYRVGEIEELLREFLPQAFFLLDDEARAKIVDRMTDEALEARASELKRMLTTPQGVPFKRLALLDPVGLSDIFIDGVQSTRSGLSIDWSSGYLLSRDRRMLLLLARPEEPPQDVDFSRQLVERVQVEVDAVLEEWPEISHGELATPQIDLGGRYVIALGDDAVIRRDVITNVLSSTVGVLLLFLFAFRRLSPLLYAVVPLASGLILTFGFSSIVYGSLSAATSGVAALLIGLGIDFIIVSYGRYVEERQSGATLVEALGRMNNSSGRAVLIGGITSAATFYSFGVTDFTGLYQMGYLTGTGILLCMVAVLVLLPAMLAWREDRHEKKRSYPKFYLHGFGSDHLMKACLRRPRAVLALAVVLAVVSGGLATRVRFEDSVQSMRPEGSAGFVIRDEIAKSFETGFDQMMLLIEGDSVAEVSDLAAKAMDAVGPLIEEGVLTGTSGVSTLIPSSTRQAGVLRWLEEGRESALDMTRIRATLLAALEAEGMRGAPFEDGLALLDQATARSVPIGAAEFQNSPEGKQLLRRYLRQTEDGRWQGVVYLYPPPQVWRREPPPQLVSLADELGPSVSLTGANVISQFMRERILGDAGVAAGLGFLLVAILLWIDYRRLSDTILSLVPLTFGILLMLGCMALLDIAMNFMNIFVSTMIIGIGVDYGVHMIHRYREFETDSLEVLESGMAETGKAIVMAALSTTVGFGSLSLSSYPGLRSLGLVAILGALFSALAAVTILPAYLSLRRR